MGDMFVTFEVPTKLGVICRIRFESFGVADENWCCQVNGFYDEARTNFAAFVDLVNDKAIIKYLRYNGNGSEADEYHYADADFTFDKDNLGYMARQVLRCVAANDISLSPSLSF